METPNLGYDKYKGNCPKNKLVKSTLLKLKKITTFELVSSSVKYDRDFLNIVIDRNTKKYEILMTWSKIFLKNKSFATLSGTESARAQMFPMEKVLRPMLIET